MNESPLTFKRSRVFIVELVMLLYALGGNVAQYHNWCSLNTASGFCDSEDVNSITHGEYRSNETEVGNIDLVRCEFGPQGSNATRRCTGHRDWQMINTEDCTSENTFRLQSLRDVRI